MYQIIFSIKLPFPLKKNSQQLMFIKQSLQTVCISNNQRSQCIYLEVTYTYLQYISMLIGLSMYLIFHLWCHMTITASQIHGNLTVFNSLFRLTTNKTSKPGGFPSQRASDAVSMSMSWHHLVQTWHRFFSKCDECPMNGGFLWHEVCLVMAGWSLHQLDSGLLIGSLWFNDDIHFSYSSHRGIHCKSEWYSFLFKRE